MYTAVKFTNKYKKTHTLYTCTLFKYLQRNKSLLIEITFMLIHKQTNENKK